MTAADLLAQSCIARRRLAELPESLRPVTLAEGYACQAELILKLVAHLGGSIIGYKIACTNEIAQKQLHVESPFSGRLLSATTYPSPALLDFHSFFMRVMEAEFAFRMSRDLPATSGSYTSEQVAEAVEGVMAGIEIVDSRFDSWTTVGTPSLIADNACHAAWVHGPLVPDWRGLDLAAQPVQLTINGAVKDTGSGAAVLGHPLNALTWLANALSSQGSGLKAGDYITTGVTTDIYLAGPGDHIVANFGEIGQIEVSFT